MDIQNGKIRVRNYEKSPCGFPSQHTTFGVFIRGVEDEEDFVVERVAFDDIEIENSKSDLFKVGRLRFEPKEEDEIYKKLGIEDRENILSEQELIQLLSEDSMDVLKRINNIKSSTLINRMMDVLFLMERSGKTPPHNVSAVVLERNSELKNGGKRNENSQINQLLKKEKEREEDGALKNTLKELQRKVADLEKEKEQEAKEKDAIIAKSQTAIEQLLAKVEALSVSPPTTQETKKAGRPPTKK